MMAFRAALHAVVGVAAPSTATRAAACASAAIACVATSAAHAEPSAAPPATKTSASAKKANAASHPKTLAEMSLNLTVKSRAVFLNGNINDSSAAAVITQLLFLEQESPYTPIRLHINSGGGKVQAGFAIHDTMQALTSPVHTICMGHCSSMAAVLLATGAEGHREAMPNARILIHQPTRVSGRGNAREFSIQAESIEKTRLRLTELLARRSGRPVSEIEELIQYDHVCDSSEALALGLIDRVVEPGSLLPSAGQSPATAEAEAAAPSSTPAPPAANPVAKGESAAPKSARSATQAP